MSKNNNSTFALIFILGALLSLVEAVTSYVESSYLEQFFSLSHIGLIVAASTVVALIWTAWHPHLIVKHGNFHSAWLTAVIILISHVALAFTDQPWLIITAFIFRFACLALLYVNFDLALEAISTDNKTGGIRAKYLTIMNLAWLASPWIMSKIVDSSHYHRIYEYNLLIVAILLFLLLGAKHQLNRHRPFEVKQIKWLSAVKLMFRLPNLRPLFMAALSLQMFYSLAILYIPIYLNQTMSIAWSDLGWIFTIMLIPFVVIELPAGLLADRYLGEKEMLIAGNLILATACACIFLTANHAPWFWAWLLLISRIGAALCESMQEIYFYKQVDSGDLGLISLFRQTKPIGWLLGATLASLILYFSRIPMLFLLMSVVFITGATMLRKITDTK